MFKLTTIMRRQQYVFAVGMTVKYTVKNDQTDRQTYRQTDRRTFVAPHIQLLTKFGEDRMLLDPSDIKDVSVAQMICREMRANLVEIETAAENNFLTQEVVRRGGN
ncbi:hypothetical protein DPMN_084254 [Dreissena polymorpha]|uniref:Uncharacterized protein n=1 Tax=Dreissena polymorpha TaxID=45954 RepID=A0A9D3YBF9_DREPO|nr:hypothetical protein DPMN_084254 [Dreissena polymorpha]